MQGVIVELSDIAKSYGQRRLFSNITRRIGPGECLAVTGPNGSGKSTLLKIIAGLVRPNSGMVKVWRNGQELVSEQRLASCGLVSPEIILYQTMTGYENLEFLTRARGATINDEWLVACLDKVGLAGRQQELVNTYSTGMRQRLKFALLAALRPSVWLLDEPSSNLDASGRQIIQSLIEEALAKTATVIIATNEAEEADHAGQQLALV